MICQILRIVPIRCDHFPILNILPMKLKNTRAFRTIIVVILSCLICPAATAAKIKVETIVPGYTGYVLVRPELRYVLGGRVRWNIQLKVFETDRIGHAERLRFTVRRSGSGEQCLNLRLDGVSAPTGVFRAGTVNLPYHETRLGVTSNPGFDDVRIIARTSLGRYECRIPIGRR